MFTTDKPTKKLFRKLDKKVPGFSYLFDPKKIFDLNKNQSDLLEVAASFLLWVKKLADKKQTEGSFPSLQSKRP